MAGVRVIPRTWEGSDADSLPHCDRERKGTLSQEEKEKDIGPREKGTLSQEKNGMTLCKERKKDRECLILFHHQFYRE